MKIFCVSIFVACCIFTAYVYKKHDAARNQSKKRWQISKHQVDKIKSKATALKSHFMFNKRVTIEDCSLKCVIKFEKISIVFFSSSFFFVCWLIVLISEMFWSIVFVFMGRTGCGLQQRSRGFCAHKWHVDKGRNFGRAVSLSFL